MRLLVIFSLIGAVAAKPDFSVSVTEQEEVITPSKPAFDTSSPPKSITSTSCKRNEENCYEDADLFKEQCKLAYSGVVNGGRCFFYNKELASWEGSFQECSKREADLTQYHTAGEFEAVYKYLQGFRPANEGLWTSLRRVAGVSGSSSLVFPYTFWYKSPTERHRRLSVANTWIRNHESDDPFMDGSYCMCTYAAYTKIGDGLCDVKLGSVCVTHNLAQTFIYVKGICIDEVPIETYFAVSLKECAMHCATHSIWCRSFNYYADGTCDLSSMIVSDTVLKSTDKRECFHYSYKP